jgi:hypothetical protein
MKHLGRLTSVIDAGTVNWDTRLLLWFQLSEYDVEPQDKTLPIYKQFAKTPYGWLIINLKSDAISFSSKEEAIALAGKMFTLDIDVGEYQWKPIYNVIWVTPSNVEDTFEWWVDVKTFLFTDETTLSDVNALGFDAKHVKNSDEYNLLRQRTLDDDNLTF